MLEGYLGALGKQTNGSANDVEEALAQIAGQQFEMAILDGHLADGELSGPVANALRAADIPFLLATGSGENSDPAYAGAPYLEKPFTLATLQAALNELS